MKKILFLSLLLSVFAIASSSAQGMTKNLEAFGEIVAKGNIKVILKKGDIEKLEIPNDDDDIQASVDEGILRIKHRKLLNYKSYDRSAIEVHVYYVTLRKVRAEAGARIKSPEVIQTPVLELDFHSGARASLDVNAEEVKTVVGQGAELALEGEAMEFHAKTTSGGQLEAFRLKAKRVYVRSSSGGEAEVFAEAYIEADANTGGSIRYKGDPDKEKINDKMWGNIDAVW